ncbi:MAG: TetR/AcrR family transcriptional regulator [Phycisphaerae bacterium]
MQKLDENKREAILTTAARLFAERPYHEVRLDDVAAEAHVGKGTVYLYFDCKQDLYRCVVLDGFDRLLARLSSHMSPGRHKDAWGTFTALVGELVAWAKAYPHAFSLMRSADEAAPRPEHVARRKELARLIEQVIRRGVASGEFEDPRPDLTAQFLPAAVRATLKFGPARVSTDTLCEHLVRVIGGGIRRKVS